MTIIEAINTSADALAKSGVCDARLDAELLLRRVLRQDRAWILIHGREILADPDQAVFDELIRRRMKREPLQYIVGTQEFWGLEFFVASGVLIPRPETELIVEAALNAVPDRNAGPSIIDLCTGSGCIAVSLAKELPTARIFATDRSAQALAVARTNAKHHGVSDRIRFFEGDLFAPLEELDIQNRIDIIVSNPPYIPGSELPTLQPEVRDYEPEIALIAGPRGTELHERIIARAPLFLKQHGTLIMEMGINQAGPVGLLVRNNGNFEEPEIVPDLAGIARVIVARRT